VDSSLVSYDGVQNVRDEEHPVERKKLVRTAEPPSKSRIRWPRWTGFRNKTVWDFLQLLIVPLMLAAIGFWFTAQQDHRQQQIEDRRAQQAQKIENQRAEAERELAEQSAQDEALQAYLDQMSQLMLERKLLEAEQGDPVHTLAQARTSTVILRLDAEHNESVTRFLINSGLAVRSEASARLLSGIVLSQATLSGAYLRSADLGGADLGNADLSSADLSNAALSKADLSRAVLHKANLSNADLSKAILFEADLSRAVLKNNADLSNAVLFQADLRGAVLRYTYLSRADLGMANLSGANLSDANLSDANLTGAKGITNEELEQQAKSLKGAIMPNRQKYEDWIKDREGRKGGGGNG
jgi:uncharacterized protein YjbI with pentapeptide repeats